MLTLLALAGVITLILTINLFLDTFVLKAKKHTVYGA